MTMDSEFVRWSSVFQHVFVFTNKRNMFLVRLLVYCVYHVDTNFLCENFLGYNKPQGIVKNRRERDMGQMDTRVVKVLGCVPLKGLG